MINISLKEKEKKILDIAYLDFYCKASACKEHRNLLELEKLKEKSIRDLDDIIKSKMLERLSEKYQDAKTKVSADSYFFRLFGC